MSSQACENEFGLEAHSDDRSDLDDSQPRSPKRLTLSKFGLTKLATMV